MSDTDLTMRPPTGIHTFGSGPSVLAESAPRIPVCGKIRPGIMVLKKAAAGNSRAVDIYQRGVDAGASWDAIEARIQKECGFEKASLVPQAVEYFGCKRADFTVKETADKILELYGEDRGDGLKLYRFPIIFAFDVWQANLPHGLKEFTAAGLKHRSEYESDGKRYCKTRGQIEVDERSKRARRSFGGRPLITVGPCEPNKCQKYQNEKCNLVGNLIFFIPGIPGSSAIELQIKSVQALHQWRSQMELVSFVRGGRISGTMDGQPIFWLTKRHEHVSMIDRKSGTALRRKEWIVHLETTISMEHVFAKAEHGQQPTTIESDAANAAAALGCAPMSDDIRHEETNADSLQFCESNACDQLRAALMDIGLDIKSFDAYAAKKWGAAWTATEQSVSQVLLHVAEARAGDLDGFIDSVLNPIPF